MRPIAAALALLLAAPAAAQDLDLTVYPSYLITPQGGTQYEFGAGAPTVAWDATNSQFVMYFESRFTGWFTEPNCGAKSGGAKWGLSRATSPDGITWTVDPAANFPPVDNTYYSCVVAHPSVIFDGTTWHLFFKAYQDDPAVTPPPAQWGSNEIVGVGYASSADGLTWNVSTDPVVLIEDDFGFPTVLEVDGQWTMLFSNTQNLQRATAPAPDGPWTWDPTPVLEPNPLLPPIEDELYDPAMVCDEGTDRPYKLFFGGFERNDANPFGLPPETASFLHGDSADGITWDVPFIGPDANPLMSWDILGGEEYWRHWDVLKVGDEYWVWFTQNTVGGNHIGLAYTGADLTFDPTTIDDKRCLGANQAPQTTADSYQTDEDVQLDVVAPGVLGNDTDREGDLFDAVLDSDVSNGTLTLNADGSFSYLPDANYTGTDSFTYVASDLDGSSEPTLVTIEVLAENDLPVGVPATFVVDEDSSLVVNPPGVLLDATDGDMDPITAVAGAAVGNGSLVLDPDGGFTYTPDPDYNGLDSFSYFPNDGTEDGAEVTVDLEVLPVNDDPTIAPDTYSTDFETPLSVTADLGLLANDDDIDGDALVAVLVQGPQGGSLSLEPTDGSFTYTPNAGFEGTDGFTYQVSDGTVLTTTTMVTIEVGEDPNPGTGTATGTGTGTGSVTGLPTGDPRTGVGFDSDTGLGRFKGGGCGCSSSGGGSVAWIALAPLALAFRRRRQ